MNAALLDGVLYSDEQFQEAKEHLAGRWGRL